MDQNDEDGRPEPEWTVSIRDLSADGEAEPVEVVRGFVSAEHADAFARRYVRDSLERCRLPGMDPTEVIEAWRSFGEDAAVDGPRPDGEEGWNTQVELDGFATYPVEDEEERDWRALDPRRDEDAPDDDDGEDSGA